MLFGVLLSFDPIASSAQQGIALDANVENSATVWVTHPQPSISFAVNAVPEGFENLKLAPGFLLQMDIYGNPEMSTKLRIDTLGNVDIPLIGAVHVEGSSVSQAQEGIQKALVDREILKNPQVMLMVLQFSSRNISVMGQVQSPGRIQLLAPTPLGDVLALAGGETAAAGFTHSDFKHDSRSPLDSFEPLSRWWRSCCTASDGIRDCFSRKLILQRSPRGQHCTFNVSFDRALSSAIDVVPNGLPSGIFALGCRSRCETGDAVLRFATILRGWSRLKNAVAALKAFHSLRHEIPGAKSHMFGIDFPNSTGGARISTSFKHVPA